MTQNPHLLHSLAFRSIKRSHDCFESNYGFIPSNEYDEAHKLQLKLKSYLNYGIKKENDYVIKNTKDLVIYESGQKIENAIIPLPEPKSTRRKTVEDNNMKNSKDLVIVKKARTTPKPEWHAPWKLCRVISGHTGWVRCISFSPDNEYFITGADDRLLKIWDFQTGKLKLSLTGHISSVRGVKISPRHPYVFSCGEDKTVKCWDLEQNKVIRHYHGHTSAVWALDIHPDLDILVTGGCDSVVRVWDMRTKMNVHVLQGHRDAISSIKCQSEVPDIISAAHDSTVRLWDLKYAKTRSIITNHKKAVRSIALHPRSDHLLAASADAIKQFALPDGQFVQNLRGHNTIINALAINDNDVVASGGNDGSLQFWDWKSAYNFQKIQTIPQSGSLDAENSILGMAFDLTSSRLVTVEGDKSIKFYKEDENATEETHPLQWRPNIIKKSSIF